MPDLSWRRHQQNRSGSCVLGRRRAATCYAQSERIYIRHRHPKTTRAPDHPLEPLKPPAQPPAATICPITQRAVSFNARDSRGVEQIRKGRSRYANHSPAGNNAHV